MLNTLSYNDLKQSIQNSHIYVLKSKKIQMWRMLQALFVLEETNEATQNIPAN